jgi:superfamily II DNA or RNA helicase
MITCTVEGALRLRTGAVRPALQRRLIQALSFPNPEFTNRLRFGGNANSVASSLCFLEQRGEEFVLPRGATRLLRDAAAAENEQLSWSDRRLHVEPRSLPFRLPLRNYQVAAVSALVEKQQGFVVLPCGAGKTVVGVAALAATGQPSLIIVHTRELLEQWCRTIKETLGLNAGTITEGNLEPAHFTVATVQTLAALEPMLLTSIGLEFGAVLVDELHHVPAATFQRVLPQFPARFRFGLTATPERADGLSPLLELCVGPRRFEVSHAELVKAGYLVIPRVVPLKTGSCHLTESHSSLVTELVVDDARNKLVLELVKREALAGRSVLVLSARVTHCELLANRMKAAGVSAAAVTGMARKAERARAMEQFRDGSLKVLFATSLADEGLDVSRLERLVLATPARAEGRTIQRLGRLMRPHPGKQTPILYDLVDGDDLSQKQFLARRRAYRKVLGVGAVEPIQERA